MKAFIVIMLPVIDNTLCNQVSRLLAINMPRVVPDQRDKFENDELFRKLSRDSEVRYTGYKDRPNNERQIRLQSDCREGHVDIAITNSGINLSLNLHSGSTFDNQEDNAVSQEYVDFDREAGKVYLKSRFIMNGVCVMWRGWLHLQRLDGAGCMEFDDDRAQVEDTLLREQIEQYNSRLRAYEDRQRHFREEQDRQAEAEAEVVQALLNISEKQ